MTVGLDAVSLEDAIDTTGVSRTSAFRLWQGAPGGPQHAYRREVLTEAIGARDEAGDALRDRVLVAVSALGPDPEPFDVYRKIVEAASDANLEGNSGNPAWQLVIALHAVVSATPEGHRDQELTAWLDEAEQAWRRSTIEGIYRPMATLLQLRPREPLTMDEALEYLVLAVSSTTEGLSSKLALRGAAAYLTAPIQRAGADGEVRPWSMFGIVLDALVPAFFHLPWEE